MKDQLAKLTKEQAIELAHRTQRARKNEEGKMAKIGTSAIGGALAAVTGGILGYWAGQAEYEYETAENKEAIDAGDEPDPRKWFGIEKELVVALVITGVGFLAMAFAKNAKLAKAGALFVAAGTGGLAAALYSKGHQSGYKSLKEAEEGEEEETA